MNPSFAALVFLAAAFTGVADNWKAGKAEIRGLRGQASQSMQEKFVKAKVGTVLRSGTILRTETNTVVDILLSDSVIRLEGASEFKFDELQFKKGLTITRLTLLKGEMWANVKKISKDSAYEVNTPQGKLSIKGTEFSVHAGGNISVQSGEVQIHLGEEKFAINTGQTWDFSLKRIRPASAAESSAKVHLSLTPPFQAVGEH